MKSPKLSPWFILLALMACVVVASCQAADVIAVATETPAKPVTVSYGNLSMKANEYRTFDDVWNLTKGDLTLSYDLDLTGINSNIKEQTAWTSVGITGGAKGWMSSGAPRTLYQDPKAEDWVDKHFLKSMDNQDERSYDATSPIVVSTPFGTYSSYGLWFDRNGIDPQQLANWGMIDGTTYNTAGKYKIVVTFHAIDAKSGTMFATVNGVQTGFYTTSWLNEKPDIYPAGKSIAGDLTKVQVQANQWTPSAQFGIARLANITVTGFLAAGAGK
ncbi:MAG: hypothetical protein M1319_03220 [Chloroflexi bacterium]|nr:hypothetical protein [Chloroflexota bacterium]